MSVERGQEFFDTNVLVYAHDSSAGEKHEKAVDILARATDEQTGALSIQVLQELFVTLTSKLPNPLAVREAARIVSDLGNMPTYSPTVSDVLGAIELHEVQSLSFWDAMVVRCAGSLGCSVVWSEDMAHGGAYDGVVVRNPFISPTRPSAKG